jgi:hypothetical protein
MRKLTVEIIALEEDVNLFAASLEIYLPSGRRIATGAASPSLPATFDLSHWFESSIEGEMGQPRVYVQAKLPGSTVFQEMVSLREGENSIVLNPGGDSPNEWLKWVTPFRSLAHLIPGASDSKANAVAVGPIGRVWATLWRLDNGRWGAGKAVPEQTMRDSGIRKFSLQVPQAPHLLQIGGEEVAWRMVSLPPGGMVRVAMTPSPDATQGAIEMTVARQQPDSELIMSYLSRGEVNEACRVADLWRIADRMLEEKFADPVSAVAGAYVLFKTRKLQERSGWFKNLVDNFSYMADVKVLEAAFAREQDGASENAVRKLLLEAMEHGLPVFSMGITLLLDTMTAMHRGERETKRFHSAYLAVQAYVKARSSRGAYFSFFGKSPAEPVWTPIYGAEDQELDGRASQGGKAATITSRSEESPRSANFGRTTVSLPGIPFGSWDKGLTLENLQYRLGGYPVRTVPRVRISLPEEHQRTITLPTYTDSETGDGAGSSSGAVVVSDAGLIVSRSTGSVSRTASTRVRTPKFWRDERILNSKPIFDGNE